MCGDTPMLIIDICDIKVSQDVTDGEREKKRNNWWLKYVYYSEDITVLRGIKDWNVVDKSYSVIGLWQEGRVNLTPLSSLAVWR